MNEFRTKVDGKGSGTYGYILFIIAYNFIFFLIHHIKKNNLEETE